MMIKVSGLPAPQGSKVRTPQGGLRESSRAVGPWREAVRAETQRAVDAYSDTDEGSGWAFTGPVEVRIAFRLPRPKSAPKNALWPAKRPDLDKLCRAVLDGLTDGGALADDGQVVKIGASKRYAGIDARPVGAWIEIVEA